MSASTLLEASPLLERLAAQHPCGDSPEASTLLGTLPLSRPGAPVQPFGVKFGGSGLDARLITDLSRLEPERLITPTPLAFIRTECPPGALAKRETWTLRTSGLVAEEGSLTIGQLTSDSRGMGPHLFECSGNNNPANFGLMSVAEWDGVPLATVIERLRPQARAAAVVVAGVDHQGQKSATSTPGASWVFPLASLDALGAFLGVRMNGEPLTPDHGLPVRLVVPGWYACTWIKWVDEIRLVPADEAATSQMQEFAGRTHQSARHELARDYAPAVIDTAAMPVRVEKRRGSNGLEYRIVGIVWGGTTPVHELAIRFGTQEPWNRFLICPPPASHRIWSLWEYRWKPRTTGVFSISLRTPDPSVRQRRLDAGYYMRQVRVDEI